jgi:dephospho-CoA kinase
LLVGITGIPGSGKTTFVSFFKKEGFPVFISDEVVKNLYKKKNVIKKIKEKFPQFFKKDLFLKEEFSKFIFKSEKNLEILENILHPLVLKELLKFKEKNKGKISVAEVPLLFEKNLESLFDIIICISRYEENSLRKFAENKNISFEEAKRRASFQLPLKLKEEKSDIVIKNNGKIEDLKKEFYNFLKKIVMKMK